MDKFNMDLTLEPVLANICQQLASFFGTTTDAVINNAPEFLAKYGWFSVLSNLGDDIVIGGILLFLLSGLLVLLLAVINDEVLYGKEKKLNSVRWGITFFIISMILNVGSSILPCIVAPEFVGLRYLLRLFDIYI